MRDKERESLRLEKLIPKQYLHPSPNLGLKIPINIWVFKMKDAVFGYL